MANPSIQFFRFTDGGYVLHKITGNFKGRISAWFDKNGELLDLAQVFPGKAKDRWVSKSGPIAEFVRTVGKRYLNA